MIYNLCLTFAAVSFIMPGFKWRASPGAPAFPFQQSAKETLMICPLSPAHFVALGAFQLFFLLLPFDVKLAILPLILFVAICSLAPLFPRFSLYLPITSRGKKGVEGVSLTFDDGPDPETTPKVLELLAGHGVTATFFVTGERASRYPELIRAILAGGHALGNHSYSHSPLLVFGSRDTLRREVSRLQELLRREFGMVPLAFRPPVGIASPKLWRVLLENGMFCVNFSLRACDMGNRRSRGLGKKLLSKAKGGDIILLHDLPPRNGDTVQLLNEFSTLIEGLQGKGVEILPLERLIGREVMQAGEGQNNAAELFYDGLAASYDQEQFDSGVSMSRSAEKRLFTARLPELFAGAGRVLEIGAGTGIFTLEIARSCREVIAADISQNMLALLEKKAHAEGIGNIRTVKGDIEKMELAGPFSVVCAFSALEYLSDLPSFLAGLAPQVEPGGALYFITARSSFFRFFTQIGNAMRQGLWLRAHSRREIESMLKKAGFEPISVCSHLLKCVINGGMLLEVVARKPTVAAAAAPLEG
jgi:peptidoglycan-N-acetylglucosamine deacetylase